MSDKQPEYPAKTLRLGRDMVQIAMIRFKPTGCVVRFCVNSGKSSHYAYEVATGATFELHGHAPDDNQLRGKWKRLDVNPHIKGHIAALFYQEAKRQLAEAEQQAQGEAAA